MHTIKMNILDTENGRKKVKQINVPSKWDELTRKQLLKVLPYAMKKDLDDYDKTKLLSQLIPPLLFKAWSDEDVQRALPLVDWVTTTDLTTPILPSFKHGNLFVATTYYLPSEALENITCQEWHFADEYYNDFIQSRNEADLDLMIATICRPGSNDNNGVTRRNDIRVPLLSRMEVAQRAKVFKNLDPNLKLYLLFFFASCKKWVYETYQPYIFEEPEDGEETADGGGLPFGWYSIFQKVAESGVFGTLSNILNEVKFHDFCAYLITKKAQFEQLKKQQEKGKKPKSDDFD